MAECFRLLALGAFGFGKQMEGDGLFFLMYEASLKAMKHFYHLLLLRESMKKK